MMQIMKKFFTICAMFAVAVVAAAQSKVYVTRDISAAGIVKAYEALGRKAEGRVAVKISTGESEKTGYLRPAMIKDIVEKVNGTIVECNTAYGGARQDINKHWAAIKERGFMDIAKVDITLLNKVYADAALRGQWRPMLEEIARAYHDTTSVRQLIEGERNIQGVLSMPIHDPVFSGLSTKSSA